MTVVAVLAGAAGLALAAYASATLASGDLIRPPAPVEPPAAAAPSPTAQFADALTRIGKARAAAFATASTDPLGGAEQPGSAAAEADRALVDRLRSSGRRLEGVEYEFGGLRITEAGERRTVLAAQITTSAHRQVAADGGTVVVPAEPDVAVSVTLVRTDPSGDWLLHSMGAGR